MVVDFINLTGTMLQEGAKRAARKRAEENEESDAPLRSAVKL